MDEPAGEDNVESSRLLIRLNIPEPTGYVGSTPTSGTTSLRIP